MEAWCIGCAGADQLPWACGICRASWQGQLRSRGVEGCCARPAQALSLQLCYQHCCCVVGIIVALSALVLCHQHCCCVVVVIVVFIVVVVVLMLMLLCCCNCCHVIMDMLG